jgi:hypothetical protein
MFNLGPLHTQDPGPVTIALQENLTGGRGSWSKFASSYASWTH